MKEKRSFGLILIKKQPHKPAEVLLVRPRCTNEFAELLKKREASREAARLVAKLTYLERQLLWRGEPSKAGRAVEHLLGPPQPLELDWMCELRRRCLLGAERLLRDAQFQSFLRASQGCAEIPWVVPRGRPLFEEQPAECAVRECCEESGLCLRDAIVDPNFLYRLDIHDMRVHYRIGHLLAISSRDLSPRLQLDDWSQRNEIAEARFFPLEHVAVIAPQLHPMLRQAFNYARRHYAFLF